MQKIKPCIVWVPLCHQDSSGPSESSSKTSWGCAVWSIPWMLSWIEMWGIWRPEQHPCTLSKQACQNTRCIAACYIWGCVARDRSAHADPCLLPKMPNMSMQTLLLCHPALEEFVLVWWVIFSFTSCGKRESGDQHTVWCLGQWSSGLYIWM